LLVGLRGSGKGTGPSKLAKYDHTSEIFDPASPLAPFVIFPRPTLAIQDEKFISGLQILSTESAPKQLSKSLDDEF
jgi:hypothetical protein